MFAKKFPNPHKLLEILFEKCSYFDLAGNKDVRLRIIQNLAKTS